MIELLISILLQTYCPHTGIVITNISGTCLPWNTTLPGNDIANPSDAPLYIIQNLPWFFPLATLMFMLYGDYIIGVKRGLDTKLQFFMVAFSYTVVMYIEVAGSLTTSGWYFLFEFIMVISLFLMILFSGNKT